MTNLLNGVLDIKSCQKLSIDDIERYWNHEIHVSAGRTRHKLQLNAKPPTDPHKKKDLTKQSSELAREQSKRGKRQTTDGKLIDDINSANQFSEYAKKGVLKIYAGAESNENPCRTSDLQNIKPAQLGKHFIDRDELGCFLISHNKPLPKFWYADNDAKIYRDRLQRQSIETSNTTAQLKLALEEIAQLKKLANEKLPFLDPSHPFFSSELEAATTAWLTHYGDKTIREDVAPKKPKLELWLKEHRKNLVFDDNGAANKSLLDRITKLINADHVKSGGRPSGNKDNRLDTA